MFIVGESPVYYDPNFLAGGVTEFCKNYHYMEFSYLSTECVNAYYEALVSQDSTQWVIVINRWYHYQPLIAIFAPFLALISFISFLYYYEFPSELPNIDSTDWHNISSDSSRALNIDLVRILFNVLQPYAFLWNAMFAADPEYSHVTRLDSLKSMDVLYMSRDEAATWLITQALLLPFY